MNDKIATDQIASGKILAFIDGSAYANSVCDLAAWFARRKQAPIEILHVLGRRDTGSAPADYSGNLDVDARDTLLQELADLDADKARLAQKRGRLILDAAKARLEAAGVPAVTTRLRHGDIVETLTEFEGDADVVVIGKRGEAADFAKLHLGSNLERIARASHKPVLVAARAFQPITRCLIAFDGGPAVTKAVQHLARTGTLREVPCTLLTVAPDNPATRTRLEESAAHLRASGYEVAAEVRSGQPEEVIARAVESEGYNLLVMGAYGHSRIRSLIIGSTTTEMIRACKIPVLLFR